MNKPGPGLMDRGDSSTARASELPKPKPSKNMGGFPGLINRRNLENKMFLYLQARQYTAANRIGRELLKLDEPEPTEGPKLPPEDEGGTQMSTRILDGDKMGPRKRKDTIPLKK